MGGAEKKRQMVAMFMSPPVIAVFDLLCQNPEWE
jgi:hypothetical protein